jgi:anaerobic selenocysteine-containing dehydrogenase
MEGLIMSFRKEMSHEISRRNFLKGTAAGALSLAVGAVLPQAGKTKAFAEDVSYVPGTYTATATGMGTVKVEVTFDEKSITDIVLDVSQETEEGLKRQNDLYYAGRLNSGLYITG